jgi:eukaryotic-like serine/threonine-protein kinase
MVDQLAPDDVVEEMGLSAEELRPGTRFGRYELLLAIAKGGMARVWAARQHGQRGFSKTVAIKTILPNLAEEPEFERMFLDEARIAALIHHPNVCEIYELGEEGKVLYLAMEWVNGESLFHILRSSGKMAPMEVRLCARIVADACAGLHAAHVQLDDEGRPLNVVHRDVSPHNILVSSDGNVKVADFGVAKALGQMHSATIAGQVKGKISYMSPEQISGAASDRRVDIFAMGVVLYEATTGRRPFTGEGDAQVMHAILGGQFVPPSRIIRGYPAELEQIVLSAMSADPNRRFATAERMRTALEEFLARSGPVVTQSQVGTFVQQRVGSVLDRRRDRIRAAANAPNPEDISGGGAVGGTPSAPARAVSGVRSLDLQTQMTPSHSVQPAPGEVTGPSIVAIPQEQPRVAKYLLAAAIGVIVAAGIGSAAILYVRSRAVEEAPSLVPTRGASSIAPPVSAPASRGSVAPPSSSVELKGLPAEAVLRIDGDALAPGVRTISRPHHGSKTSVLVSAPGFADETVTLDESTPSSVEVAMTLQSGPDDTAKPAAPTLTTTATVTSQNTASTGAAPTPSKRIALPANPY